MDLEVPHAEDLEGLDVELTYADTPGVASVTANAIDGSVVTLTWDVIAGSVSVCWLISGVERLNIERETASKISIHDRGDGVDLRVWSRSEGVVGKLVIEVSGSVRVTDTTLRA